MGKMPDQLRDNIARNIRECRLRKFPGRGGGKKCAETFGVSPQQWSPWESGKRTPDELRLEKIAVFFGVTVEWLRQDHRSDAAQPDTGAAYTHARLLSEKLPTASNPDFIYDIMSRLMELHQRCANHIHTACGNDQQTEAGTAASRLPSTGEPTKKTGTVGSELL